MKTLKIPYVSLSILLCFLPLPPYSLLPSSSPYLLSFLPFAPSYPSSWILHLLLSILPLFFPTCLLSCNLSAPSPSSWLHHPPLSLIIFHFLVFNLRKGATPSFVFQSVSMHHLIDCFFSPCCP